jgi:DNA-damage-inducible protein D
MSIQSPDFDSIKQINPYGAEYWSARDLMPLLGYAKKWQNFESVIKKAMIACEETENFIEHHFTDASKPIAGGKGSTQHVKDYYLSRLACYLIAQNGDPRKSEIAAAQLYFAVSTRSNEMHQLYEEQQQRLQLREQVAEKNSMLADAAYQAGVQSKNFGRFNDAGYLGMYMLTSSEIKEHKGIPPKEELLDNIGSEELAANYFRITQTESKLRREEITGEDNANQAHFHVGRIVRNAIEQVGGQMPEDLPSAPSIKKLLDEKRREKRKQLKQQDKAQDTEQGKLFE